MTFSIRPLIPSDYPAAAKIWQQELGPVALEDFVRIQAQMAGIDAYRSFAAVCGEEVVGLITTVRVLAVDAGSYLKINGLCVRRDWQRQGVVRALLSYAQAYAESVGTHRFILNSGFQRTGAHAFYEKLGFDKRSFCLTKRF